jgi:hypothetical protein
MGFHQRNISFLFFYIRRFRNTVLSNRPWSFSPTPRVGQEVESPYNTLAWAQKTFDTRGNMFIEIRCHRTYTHWKLEVFTLSALFKSFVSEAFANEKTTTMTTTKLLCVRICCCSASSVQWLVHHNVCGWFLQAALSNKSFETCTKQCAL